MIAAKSGGGGSADLQAGLGLTAFPRASYITAVNVDLIGITPRGRHGRACPGHPRFWYIEARWKHVLRPIGAKVRAESRMAE